MASIVSIKNQDHDIAFDITLSGNISEMKSEDLISEFKAAFEEHLHNSCEYMVDFSVSEENQSKIHDLIESSKAIIKELNNEKVLQTEGAVALNKAYEDRLIQHIIYEFRDGRTKTSDLAHEFLYRASVYPEGGDSDDGDDLEDVIDDDLFTALRDEVMFVIEADLDKNLTLNDLLGNNRQETEFMYMPNFDVDGLGIVEDYPVQFETNYSSVDSMILDESAERMFTLFNMNPTDFASHLKLIGKDDEIVEKYQNIKGVTYSLDRGPMVSCEDLVTIIDNSYSCVYPIVYGNVKLADLLGRDISKPFVLEKPLYALHDFVNGAGHIERGKSFTIEPNDLDFTGGKAYRYSVDDVYGFTSSGKDVEIHQPMAAPIFHADIGDEGLLGKLQSLGKKEHHTKSRLEKFGWYNAGLTDVKTGNLLSDDSSVWHLAALPVDDARVLCAIHEESDKLRTCTSSKDLAVINAALHNIETKFSVNCTRLWGLGLIEQWCCDDKAHFETTPIGKVFYPHESSRLAELTKEASWFEMK
jgi:hypothetical protein